MVWQGVKVCEDLDWKRAFSLHLWYHRPSSALLSDALASYEDSFKGRTSAGVYANEPRPSYLDDEEESQDDSDSEELMEHRSKTCRDTCYHLIKLFCKRSHRLDSTLAPASYTRHQLDVSLRYSEYWYQFRCEPDVANINYKAFMYSSVVPTYPSSPELGPHVLMLPALLSPK